MEIKQEAIDKAKLDAGARDVHQVDVGDEDSGISLLVVAPSQAEWTKFLSDLTSTDDIGKKTMAHQNLVLAVSKYPDRETIKAFIARQFGSVTKITDCIGEIVGTEAKVRVKKL